VNVHYYHQQQSYGKKITSLGYSYAAKKHNSFLLFQSFFALCAPWAYSPMELLIEGGCG
jgi:hypothetical protein